MINITKCKGIGCPIKGDCIRYTQKATKKQSWFVKSPFNKKAQNCLMYIRDYSLIPPPLLPNKQPKSGHSKVSTIKRKGKKRTFSGANLHKNCKKMPTVGIKALLADIRKIIKKMIKINDGI